VAGTGTLALSTKSGHTLSQAQQSVAGAGFGAVYDRLSGNDFNCLQAAFAGSRNTEVIHMAVKLLGQVEDESG
jgi:hypothetical protein